MINLQKITDILFNNSKLELALSERKAIEDSYNFLLNFSKDKVIYGINTGFGPMAQYRICDNDLNELQYNIIRSHSCGAGKDLEPLYVRAAMLARYKTFTLGKSGVHINLVNQLKEFINKEIYPSIPEHGSVGASGDLVQLSHLALTLIGEGNVYYKGEKRSSKEVLKELTLEPLKLHLRDGLSAVNGTAVMTGIGLVNLIYSKKLISWSLIFSLLMNEIASSYDDFLAEELNNTKLHYGQRRVAELMRQIAKDSNSMLKRQDQLYNQKHEEMFFGNEKKVQPYYSLRCVPQILGPVLDELVDCEKVLINEINSVDDNPVVDMESKSVYHGGNFHGDYISFEMDKLKIAITKMTILSERQLNYLLHDRINGILPPFVNLGRLGLNYGLQAAQFTATSTTAESQTLSNPMYVHSIPNNNDNQDIVSMGTNSALLAKKVIDNAYQVFAIQSLALVQAVEILQIQDNLSPITQQFYKDIRNLVPVFIEDTPKYEEIEKIIEFLRTKEKGIKLY
ncbi:MAG: MIO-dependent tyrosine 2,3-aminomutase [Bacteroidetes bacterium]|nr:MIO-dependent tyrosine 2,3-aminomutase [Bacteroidota bacterium]